MTFGCGSVTDMVFLFFVAVSSCICVTSHAPHPFDTCVLLICYPCYLCTRAPPHPIPCCMLYFCALRPPALLCYASSPRARVLPAPPCPLVLLSAPCTIRCIATFGKPRIDAATHNLENLTLQAPAAGRSPSKRSCSDSLYDAPASHPSPKKRQASSWNSFTQSFRNDNTTEHPSRCPCCLDRDRHNIRMCKRTTLWDNKTPARCVQNKHGHLSNPAGIELCTNYQRLNGCTDTTHPTKHECSECGEPSHGAASCPLGP